MFMNQKRRALAGSFRGFGCVTFGKHKIRAKSMLMVSLFFPTPKVAKFMPVCIEHDSIPFLFRAVVFGIVFALNYNKFIVLRSGLAMGLDVSKAYRSSWEPMF